MACVLLGGRIWEVEIDHRGGRLRTNADELPHWRIAVVLAAGPAASLALSAALAAVATTVGDELLRLAFQLAAAATMLHSALAQLVPVRLRRHRSDGYLCLARGVVISDPNPPS